MRTTRAMQALFGTQIALLFLNQDPAYFFIAMMEYSALSRTKIWLQIWIGFWPRTYLMLSQLAKKKKSYVMAEKGHTYVKFRSEAISDGFGALGRLLQKRTQKNTQKWPFLGVFGQNSLLIRIPTSQNCRWGYVLMSESEKKNHDPG